MTKTVYVVGFERPFRHVSTVFSTEEKTKEFVNWYITNHDPDNKQGIGWTPFDVDEYSP